MGVGILGCGKVGKIHARHYHQLGEKVTRILCNSQKNADHTVQQLNDNYGFQTIATSKLDNFFSENMDMVSICSPPSFHMEHIKACLDRKIPVFCEKPLFWDEDITQKKVSKQLTALKKHTNRLLFVNTSNTVFLDAINKKQNNNIKLKELSFEFYTNGEYKGINIAKDLLPHGLSLLIHSLGDKLISNFRYLYSDHVFKCTLQYGSCLVKFDFQENPKGPKHMKIGLNNRYFTRYQIGEGPNFCVYLIDETTKKKISVEDPFKVYLRDFIGFVRSKKSKTTDGFRVAELNMNKMAACLGFI